MAGLLWGCDDGLVFDSSSGGRGGIDVGGGGGGGGGGRSGEPNSVDGG